MQYSGMRDRTDASDTPDESFLSKRPEFSHGVLLFSSLSVPLLVMMAFGGRPALLVLCFGGLVAYIFDLLGTIEVRSPFFRLPL
jgi:hypothetical protein